MTDKYRGLQLTKEQSRKLARQVRLPKGLSPQNAVAYANADLICSYGMSDTDISLINVVVASIVTTKTST